MNAFMVIFSIIGIVVTFYALGVFAVWATSYIVLAVKSYKYSIDKNLEITKTNIDGYVEARKERLSKKREQTLKIKSDKLDMQIDKKEKKILLERKKLELKKKEDVKDNVAEQVEEVGVVETIDKTPLIETAKKEDLPIAPEEVNQVKYEQSTVEKPVEIESSEVLEESIKPN